MDLSKVNRLLYAFQMMLDKNNTILHITDNR